MTCCGTGSRTAAPWTGKNNEHPQSICPARGAFATLIGAGFTDAWNVTHPGEAGNTCCHAADLRDTDTRLSERIDLVLIRGNVAAQAMSLVGNELADRTASGLWPSDHDGVVGTLNFPSQPQDDEESMLLKETESLAAFVAWSAHDKTLQHNKHDGLGGPGDPVRGLEPA